MSDTTESQIARLAVTSVVLSLLLLAGTTPIAAQQPGPLPIDKPSDTVEFFPRYTFQIGGNTLSGDDTRFMSDAHYGGATDLIDYTVPFKGRINIVADYEAVLGTEYRIFDPNQSIYILEGSGSFWLGKNEIAGVFHHISRHLSDRPKNYGIAFNSVGIRYLRLFDVGGGTSVAVSGRLAKVIAKADVDYTWESGFAVTLRHVLKPHMGVFAHGWGDMFAVDPVLRGRTAQHGGRFEGGVRFDGRGGALEVYVGVEHRLDADPHDYLPVTWGIFGFRLMSK